MGRHESTNKINYEEGVRKIVRPVAEKCQWNKSSMIIDRIRRLKKLFSSKIGRSSFCPVFFVQSIHSTYGSYNDSGKYDVESQKRYVCATRYD